MVFSDMMKLQNPIKWMEQDRMNTLNEWPNHMTLNFTPPPPLNTGMCPTTRHLANCRGSPANTALTLWTEFISNPQAWHLSPHFIYIKTSSAGPFCSIGHLMQVSWDIDVCLLPKDATQCCEVTKIHCIHCPGLQQSHQNIENNHTLYIYMK